MQHTPDADHNSPSTAPPVVPPQRSRIRPPLIRLFDGFLHIQMVWVGLAVLFVYISCLLDLGPACPWIGLALACLPFPLQVARSGLRTLRTPFDLPMALVLVGAIVGFCVSDDRTISLGALQGMIAMTLCYYSWVNFAPLARIIKRVVISLALIFLVLCVFYLVVISFIDGRPNLDVLGSGTHHGFAMCLAIEGAILLGIAAFDRNKRTRLVSIVLFLVFLVLVVVWTRESLHSLFGGDTVSGRWPIWEKTAHLLGESPLAGLGLGCWALARWGTTVLGTSEIDGITHAHNAYLELYSNTGMVGALALLVALGIGVKLSMDIIRSPRTQPWYGFGIGVILACVVTLMVGMVESAPMGVPLVGDDTYCYVISPAAWLLCGLLVVSHRHITKGPGT